MPDSEFEAPKAFQLDPATADASRRTTRRDHCFCLAVRGKKGTPLVPNMHVEPQNDAAPSWSKLLALIDRLAAAKDQVFEPSSHLQQDEWIQVITLPSTLASLSDVTEIRLYGSHLRRLPPEIGRMSSLRTLDIYTSYSLHWLPYEVTRCARLEDSRMSTRALYGNRKTRLPFPRLSRPVATLRPATCSICDRPFDGREPLLFWTTQRVGTDDVPLLIHACSLECVDATPSAPPGFVPRPHKGGGGVGMPVDQS